MLLDLLAACPHPLAVTLALAPERVAAQVRRTLESEAARFGRLAEPHDDPGARTRLPPDSAAAGLAALYRDALDRYGDRAFRFGVTVASPVTLDEMVVEALGRTVSPAGYAAARPGRPAEYEALAHALATLQPVELPEPALPAQLAADLRAGGVGPVRRGLLDLRCLVDRVEVRALFRLPVAADGHVPGFPVVAAAVPAAATLLAGRHAEDGSEVRFPVRDVSIGGTPGWARAATARHLCRQLWADQRIPFLLLTSSTEHRSLDAVVFTPGDESVAPLRLNPFEVPVGTTVGRHIADLLRIFDAAYGLPEPLPLLYRRALTRIYRQCGHHPDVVGAEGLVWPTLREFVAAADFDVATRLRGEALLEGAAGATLDCRRSFDAGALVDRPVVVELGAARDTAAERVLVGLLLLHVVRRAAQGRRHVIVIDDPALATDDAAVRIVHRGSLRARLMYPEPVPVLVPDPDVDGAVPTDVEVRGRFERLLDDPRFAAALAPFDECEECGHRCAYRRRAESVVLADPAAATRLVDQVADGSWAATAADLTALDGPEDYRMCVFVHAVRTARAAEPLQLVRQMRRHLPGNPVP